MCASAKRRIVKMLERMGELERVYFVRAVAARTQWELEGAEYWLRQLRVQEWREKQVKNGN